MSIFKTEDIITD